MKSQKNKKDPVEFKGLVDNLQIGVFRATTKPKNRFLFVNSMLGTILGYPREKLVKMSPSDIFENSREYRSFNRKLRKENFVTDEQVKLKRKDGTPLWCSITARAERREKSKMKWFDGVVEDISQKKEVEKELIKSKELFRVVFDNSAVAITVLNKDEQLIAWNPFAEKLLGMKKKDLMNKPVKELYAPGEWRRIRAFRIRKKGMLPNLETKILKKDGDVIDVSMSISVLKDSKGRITGSIGIMRDITKQKIAEQKLKESESKTRIILEHTAAAIMLIDPKERIVSWNKFTEAFLGMKKKDLYLKPVKILYPPEEWKKIRDANIRQLGSKHHFETRVITKDGKTLNVDLSVNILKDSIGNIIGSVGIMQDITGRKDAHAMLLKAKIVAEEASASKSTFLAHMSHEVRTPMNAIIGMIDMTLDTKLTEEQKDNLKTAKDAAGNLLNLLNDILDLSRIEAGKVSIDFTEFNIHEVVKSVCKGLFILARNKNLDLQWSVDKRAPMVLIGDPTRIRQVLINLVNNAIKFTQKGSVEIRAGVESLTKDECRIVFSVKDTGIGIPEEKQSAIFEAFTQADGTVTKKYGGTGLGLTISMKLAQLMDGDLRVKSKPSEGSTFFFRARFKIPPKETPVSRVAKSKDENSVSEAIHKKRIKDLHVLVAEDNLVNQRIVVKLLEKHGWSSTAVEDGQQALDAMEKEDFDLILMDVQMPVLDGLKATKAIREKEKETGKHIPIIALTARAMQGDEEKCLSSGMDSYIAKPIDRAKLYELIEDSIK